MTDILPEYRKKHPYVMYEMMKQIPEGIDKTLKAAQSVDYSFLGDDITFIGNGTAYHAGYIGSGIIEKYGLRRRVVQAYEYLNYLKYSSSFIGISHTGKTKSTVDAMLKARITGKTAGITHYRDSPLYNSVDVPILIEDEDKSLCNTKAFFNSAFAALYVSSIYLGKDIDFKSLRNEIAKHVNDDDKEMESASAELDNVKDIFVLGSGPNFPVAREAAQKIREATHLHAEGIELEEFNHGCTAVMDENTLVILVETERDKERANQIVRASSYVGSPTMAINGDAEISYYSDYQDEYLSPFVNMVPLYYLAYYLAVRRGINPDYLRFEDERYRNYDNTVFPPGAH
ncbi:hypothetical protein [Thermoplasma volcanium GSS1]|uniref:SIS domain-containing protein n=1 Tax=Thermoplasma volcanium (strain ATCC 51530 / DSM 4299 / JCM 9571 / NBRC 15438 / GSS1) TaxID=273116 RepID=Q97AH1_THEVO|nr:SIS domain-containing protein [Thermoplasma volcanium]BAB59981.1 hypothetical protein [Thermoplasma volcanium GSS1]